MTNPNESTPYAAPGPDDCDRSLHHFEHGRPKCRRQLQTYSRYDETPHRLVIELTEDGTDYVSHGDFEEVEFTQSWQPLRLELEGAANRLTLQEIRKQWSGFAPPDEVTL